MSNIFLKSSIKGALSSPVSRSEDCGRGTKYNYGNWSVMFLHSTSNTRLVALRYSSQNVAARPQKPETVLLSCHFVQTPHKIGGELKKRLILKVKNVAANLTEPLKLNVPTVTTTNPSFASQWSYNAVPYRCKTSAAASYRKAPKLIQLSTMKHSVINLHEMVLFGLTHLILLTTQHSSFAFSPSHIIPPLSRTITSLEMKRKGNRNSKFKQSIDTPSYTSRNRPQINDVMDSITSPPSFPHSVDPNDLPPGSVNDDPLAEFVETIVHAADMRKASDIVAMRVMKCTSLTNFIVIVSGTSRPQNQAIANSIMVDVEEKHDGKRCLGNVSLLHDW